MRNFLLIIYIGFLSYVVNSQTHSPIFPDTNAVWIQRLFVPPDVTDIFGDGRYYNHFVYTKKQVGQDTQYNQLLELSWTYGDYDLFKNEFLDFDEIMVPEEKVLGKFRIEGNKVFYKHLNITPLYETYSFSETSFSNNLDSTEIVLYDFGLEENDTFRIAYSNSLLRVTSKDSILIEGTYYDRFFFEHDSSDLEYWLPYNYHWIAGVGSSMGFFPYYSNFEKHIEFICFHDDYDLFDYFPIGNNCYFAQLSELSQSNFSIYPQPFTSSFTVSSRSELTSSLSFQLVDVFGRTHLQGKLENQTQIIDAEDLPAGMYFLKIDNGNGKILGYKMIK